MRKMLFMLICLTGIIGLSQTTQGEIIVIGSPAKSGPQPHTLKITLNTNATLSVTDLANPAVYYYPPTTANTFTLLFHITGNFQIIIRATGYQSHVVLWFVEEYMFGQEESLSIVLEQASDDIVFIPSPNLPHPYETPTFFNNLYSQNAILPDTCKRLG